MELFFRIIIKIFFVLTILAGCSATQEIKETDSLALLNQGVAFGKEGQYDRAIANYNKAIEINPRFATAYNQRGEAYFKKDRRKACFDWRKACELGSCKTYGWAKVEGLCN